MLKLMKIVFIFLFSLECVRAVHMSSRGRNVETRDGSKLRVMRKYDVDLDILWDEFEGYCVKESKEEKVLRYGVWGACGMKETKCEVGKDDPKRCGVESGCQIPDECKKDHGRSLASLTMNTDGKKNMVVLMRFKDHDETTHKPKEGYEFFLNSLGADKDYAPSGTVRSYFLSESGLKFDFKSQIHGWVEVDYSEKEAAGGCSGLTTCQNKFRNAIYDALVKTQGEMDFTGMDVDGDGYIDSMTIIHSGYGAEQQMEGHDDMIWSHRSNLPVSLRLTDKNGVTLKVFTYNANPALNYNNDIVRLGLVVHELGHQLGLPDLYDYDDSSLGVGIFSVMGNAWGSSNGLIPGHFDAQSRIELGWVKPIVFQRETVPNAKLPIGGVFKLQGELPDNEYYLVEHRRHNRMSNMYFGENYILIWHVDLNVDLNQDENHPRVRLVQADAEPFLNQDNSEEISDVFGVGSQFSIYSSPKAFSYSPKPCQNIAWFSMRVKSIQKSTSFFTGFYGYNYAKYFVIDYNWIQPTCDTTFDYNSCGGPDYAKCSPENLHSIELGCFNGGDSHGHSFCTNSGSFTGIFTTTCQSVQKRCGQCYPLSPCSSIEKTIATDICPLATHSECYYNNYLGYLNHHNCYSSHQNTLSPFSCNSSTQTFNQAPFPFQNFCFSNSQKCSQCFTNSPCSTPSQKKTLPSGSINHEKCPTNTRSECHPFHFIDYRNCFDTSKWCTNDGFFNTIFNSYCERMKTKCGDCFSHSPCGT